MEPGKKRGHGVDGTLEGFKKLIAERNWPEGMCYESELNAKVAPPRSSDIHVRLAEESRGLALQCHVFKKLTDDNPKNPVMGNHFSGSLVQDLRDFRKVSKSLITGTMVWVAFGVNLPESGIDVNTELAKETAWVIEDPSVATSTTIREVMDKVYKWTKDTVQELHKWRGRIPL